MEVFIGFTKDDDFNLLRATLEMWAESLPENNIVATQCNRKNKFQIDRRLVAEATAVGPYYILADLGCVPAKDAVDLIESRLPLLDDSVGMVGLARHDGAESTVPTGVRICKKGMVQKWMGQVTDTYDAEHASAVKLEGAVVFWPDVHYGLVEVAVEAS